MITKEQAKKELARRELARRKLKYYIDYIYTDYIFGEWHEKIFDALERIEAGTLKRLIVQLPPRSGKTEIISKQFPSYVLGKYPKKRIIGASYGASLASDNGRASRRIVNDEKYKNVFPKFVLSQEKKEQHNWETKEGGGYYTVGIGGALTGRGFDIGIIDDYCKDREEAESPTIREKVWDWYTSTFYTRKQGEHSAIIVLATRWHIDDLIGRLLTLKEGDNWEVISFPALNEKEESFFPERFNAEYYKNERANIGVRDFSALYQQDPILSMGACFNKEDFRYFALSDFEKVESITKKSDFDVGVFVDPAFSTRIGSDDVVSMVVGQHRKSKELYILDIVSGPFPPSIGSVIPINLAEKWKSAGYSVRMISVEDVSLNKDQALFVDSVDAEMRRRGLFFTLHRFKPNGKKEDRIKFRLEPVFNRNAIHFRCDDLGNSAWHKLEEQLLKFPSGNNDDHPDCLAQAIEVFDKNVSVSEEFVNQQISYAERMMKIRG